MEENGIKDWVNHKDCGVVVEGQRDVLEISHLPWVQLYVSTTVVATEFISVDVLLSQFAGISVGIA